MDQQLLGLDALISTLLAGTARDPVAEIMAMERIHGDGYPLQVMVAR